MCLQSFCSYCFCLWNKIGIWRDIKDIAFMKIIFFLFHYRSSARNSYNTVDMNCYGNYLQYCDVRKSAYCSSVVYIYCNGRLSSHFWMKNVHRIENAHILKNTLIIFASPIPGSRFALYSDEEKTSYLFVCLFVILRPLKNVALIRRRHQAGQCSALWVLKIRGIVIL